MSRKKPQEERTDEILNAALRCFARRGYDGTTMDDIVRESGLTKGGIYWYYKSKRDIFTALFDRHSADDLGRWKEYLKNDHSIRQVLLEQGSAVIREHLDDPWLIPLFNVMITEAFRDEAIKEKMVTLWKRGIAGFAELVTDSADTGDLDPGQIHRLTTGITAFSFGLMLLAYLSRETIEYEKTWHDFITLIFDGMEKKDRSAGE